jgi:hypothetical protein
LPSRKADAVIGALGSVIMGELIGACIDDRIGSDLASIGNGIFLVWDATVYLPAPGLAQLEAAAIEVAFLDVFVLGPAHQHIAGTWPTCRLAYSARFGTL